MAAPPKQQTTTNIPKAGVRVTGISQFQNRITGFQQQYGVTLQTQLLWNVNPGNGTSFEFNQWTLLAQYQNGFNTISITPVTGQDLSECLNMMLDRISAMLHQYGGQRRVA